MLARIRSTLELVKFSHTVFALPFALLSAFLAARGVPPLPKLGLIVLAMVFARTGAMAVNRVADRRFDADNPRTAGRALVTGELEVGYVTALAIASFALLVGVAAALNPLALALSPVAIALLSLYSFTKRFTWASHAFLGLALGGAPLGAWVAVTGELAWAPALLGLAVLLWVTGFDIIYACQDVEVDRGLGLRSVPARFGIDRALAGARWLHLGMVACLFALPVLAPLGAVYLAGAAAVAALLIYEHKLVGPRNLERLNEAFFTVNGLVSVLLFLCVAVDLALFAS